MKMTLFIEFGALTCGLGMLVGGFFGMNLKTGLEDSGQAFGTVIVVTGLLMIVSFAWLVKVVIMSFKLSFIHLLI